MINTFRGTGKGIALTFISTEKSQVRNIRNVVDDVSDSRKENYPS